jgi:hypothetical protein
MTLLISAFGFAGRFAGDLLTSALGWASSLLFGRVPRSHQVLLVLMMALSFLWLLVILALILPSIGSFLLAATPHLPFMDNAWLGWALLVTAIALPLVIGLVGYLVPSDGARPEGLAIAGEILRGYLLAPLIGGLLLYLSVIGLARKARSARHGWSDIHVAIVVAPDRYEQMAADVERAVDSAGLEVVVREAPKAVTAPAWLLGKVAGENVRRLRPDRLLELSGRHLRIGIYPSDIAISGTIGSRTRARAAILSRFVATAVHQTTSAEAQAVEDRLHRIATSRRDGKASFDAIDAELLELEVPTDEWDVLYRIRLQIERDLLVHAAPGTVFPGHDPRADASAASTRHATTAKSRPAKAAPGVRRRRAAPRSATTPS